LSSADWRFAEGSNETCAERLVLRGRPMWSSTQRRRGSKATRGPGDDMESNEREGRAGRLYADGRIAASFRCDRESGSVVRELRSWHRRQLGTCSGGSRAGFDQYRVAYRKSGFSRFGQNEITKSTLVDVGERLRELCRFSRRVRSMSKSVYGRDARSEATFGVREHRSGESGGAPAWRFHVEVFSPTRLYFGVNCYWRQRLRFVRRDFLPTLPGSIGSLGDGDETGTLNRPGISTSSIRLIAADALLGAEGSYWYALWAGGFGGDSEVLPDSRVPKAADCCRGRCPVIDRRRLNTAVRLTRRWRFKVQTLREIPERGLPASQLAPVLAQAFSNHGAFDTRQGRVQLCGPGGIWVESTCGSAGPLT
jgi:hypothetical protein